MPAATIFETLLSDSELLAMVQTVRKYYHCLAQVVQRKPVHVAVPGCLEPAPVIPKIASRGAAQPLHEPLIGIRESQ